MVDQQNYIDLGEINMNNNGWSLKEFIMLLIALAFCLIVVVYLGNQIKKIENKG